MTIEKHPSADPADPGLLERLRSLQVALIVPLVVGFLGIVNALRMRRLPDPEPSEAAESLLVG